MHETASDAASQRIPTLRARVVWALLIGVLAGAYTWYSHDLLFAKESVPDSVFLWRAARIVLAGGDPYPAGALNHMPVGELDAGAWRSSIESLYYPGPALLLWLPFATPRFLVGSTLFSAVGAALFALAISRGGLHRLWLCGSMPFVMALHFGQWSTFTTAAALMPLLGFLAPAKPNLGLPVVLAAPRLPTIIGCVLVLVASLLWLPHWPLAWWQNITGPFRDTVPHPAPITQWRSLGFLLALALLRWRRMEARLLLLMACVPQLGFWADQLPLAIVPQTRREVIWSVIAGGLAITAYQLFAPKVVYYVPVMQPYALMGTYLPALWIVLRRPNAGAVPAWIESLVVRLPAGLRGQPAPSPT